jgi:hypothetical protein
MSLPATRVLTIIMCATAIALFPVATPAEAATNSSKHLKKHKRTIQTSPGLSDPWSAGRAWPSNQAWSNNQSRPNNRSYTQTGRTCFRAIDCATWPPPIDEDPDRRVIGRGH